MSDNLIKEKSYQFAIRIIKLCLWLKENKHFEISSQLLRSGTSIGANVEEASATQSKKDFISKMSIASKEAREINYWLKLVRDSDLDRKIEFSDLINESEELIKILPSIVKTSQKQN